MSKRTKNIKKMPVTTPFKHKEEEFMATWAATPSQAKISGEDINQSFSRIRDIEAIPGWGVNVLLNPRHEGDRENMVMSYYQAYDLVKNMDRFLPRIPLEDVRALSEMFTKFKAKLLEAIEHDHT